MDFREMMIYEQHGNKYDVRKIWNLAKSLPTYDLSMDAPDVYCYLASRTWAGCKSPFEVLVLQDNSHGHMTRIWNADLSFPIVLAPNFGVVDGMHRLAKAYMQKEELIRVQRFESWDGMAPALVR